jgi:hypothetical protein
MPYSVRLAVPCCSGWRAWDRSAQTPADAAVAPAVIASEHRRGAEYVRVMVAATAVVDAPEPPAAPFGPADADQRADSQSSAPAGTSGR